MTSTEEYGEVAWNKSMEFFCFSSRAMPGRWFARPADGASLSARSVGFFIVDFCVPRFL
jgi:hypothetical protein